MEKPKKTFSLILLETPDKNEIGLDNLTLKPGQLFKGIKEIPFGAHFLYTVQKLGKSSMFLYFSDEEVIVLKWNSSSEDFRRLPEDEETLYASSIDEFYPMMVKYPEESQNKWKELTGYISKRVIFKLEPLKHSIYSANKEYDSSAQDFESFSTSQNLIYYSSIPKRWIKHGMSLTEITEFNFDKSYILIEILQKDFETPEDLFGEFQFAYISFLIGENAESFQQWKDLLVLLCNCDRALFSHYSFYANFIPVLYSQIQCLPKDLIFDPFLSSSFITSSLKAFVSLLDNQFLNKTLVIRGTKLKELIMNEFGINELEMANDDDEAPCIVDSN